MTEREFQQAVVDLARATGWLVYHTFDSRRSMPGFPDLVLVPGVSVRAKLRDTSLGAFEILWRELKTDKGSIRPEQRVWLDALADVGADVGVWRPKDWPVIERTLTTGSP